MEKGKLDDLLKEVGAFQRDKIGNIQLEPEKYGLDISIHDKDGGKDYFTLVDQHIEALAKEELTHLLPGSGFIGEESEAVDAGERYVWMIDPIDGTAVYRLGGDNYSSSIALLDRQENKIILGSVYQPMRAKQYSRTTSKILAEEIGVLIEGWRPDMLTMPIPSESKCFGEWLGCSFGSSKYYPEHPGIKERVENVFSETFVPELKRSYAAKDAKPASGSTNLFCCQIGAGERHFALEFFQKPWDLAVGALYARDVGCPVILLDDMGNILDQDIEEEIVNSTPDTLLNVGVFANKTVKDYVLGKFLDAAPK